jgi:hypothetical protein
MYIVNSWGGGGTGFESVFSKIAEVIRERQPDATVTVKGRNTEYSVNDPELWKEMKAAFKRRCDYHIAKACDDIEKSRLYETRSSRLPG